MSKIDVYLVKVATRFAALCSSVGLKYPMLLIAWMSLFLANLFCSGAWLVVDDMSLMSFIPLVLGVLFAESFRKRIVQLFGDAKKEWSKALYEKYALVALRKREGLSKLRIGLIFLVPVMVLPNLIALYEGNDDQLPYTIIVIISSLIVLIGSYVEAAEPPMPNEGDRVGNVAPSQVTA